MRHGADLVGARARDRDVEIPGVEPVHRDDQAGAAPGPRSRRSTKKVQKSPDQDRRDDDDARDTGRPSGLADDLLARREHLAGQPVGDRGQELVGGDATDSPAPTAVADVLAARWCIRRPPDERTFRIAPARRRFWATARGFAHRQRVEMPFHLLARRGRVGPKRSACRPPRSVKASSTSRRNAICASSASSIRSIRLAARFMPAAFQRAFGSGRHRLPAKDKERAG